MSQFPIITGSPWTQADDDQLRTLAAAGESCSIIAELSKRSHSSIRKRARMLKIKLRSRPDPETEGEGGSEAPPDLPDLTIPGSGSV
jgi:hypothetical protein